MSLISINIEKKKNLYFILGIIIFIFEDIILSKYDKNNYNNKCNKNFLNFVSKIFLIFPYFIIIQYQTKTKNKIFNAKNIIFIDKDKIYNFKILPQNRKFRNYILKLLFFFILSELFSIFVFFKIPDKTMKLHRYKMSYFFSLLFFYKILFNKSLFMHHYLSLIVLLVVIALFIVNNIFILQTLNSKFIHIIYNLTDLIVRCLTAFNVVLFKFLLEMCYMNGYLIFFSIGVIQIILSLIIYSIKKFTLFDFPFSLIVIIFYFIKNFFFIIFIHKYNPCLYGIISYGFEIYFYFRYCIKKDKILNYEFKIIFQLVYILGFLILLVFSETIQFNFWGLNRHTMAQEILKSKIEELDHSLHINEDKKKKRKTNINFFD